MLHTRSGPRRGQAPGLARSPVDARLRRHPYVGYDSRKAPSGFYRGPLPDGIPALARFVAVGDEAWSLELLRRNKTVTKGDLTISWEPGQNSALDTSNIAEARDVGNVVVRRSGPDGPRDVVHDIVFAFVFHAFRPSGTIHHVDR